ncbi:glycosyltransferase [Ancylobacter sp. SL191]|uniref:glycosyltransferase n=1 Tax=Ancylobacter sp. SL191 TaxID=2995166 RepID=UPI002271C93D|nr:glycosyltransferase [Ancylobacter sp. SL191]WAC28637.1 glycosyltransferase [Ancylobacter sp. SL191]
MRILAWPAFSNKNDNPYQYNLYQEMLADSDVVECRSGPRSILRLMGQRFDIFHVHWIDKVLWRDSRRQIALGCLLLSALLLRLRLGGTSVVWTVHDPQPHRIVANERSTRFPVNLLWRAYHAIMMRSIGGLIFLSATHRDMIYAAYPRLARLPYCVVPHPSYIGSYPDTVDGPTARQALSLDPDARCVVFFGKIRPYKGVEALITAFRGLRDEDARLLIAGEPDSPDYLAALVALAEGDPRIRFEARFIAGEDIQLFMRAANVVVLPFAKATNSGSVALSLSFRCRTAVPDIAVFREVQEVVGPEWLHLYEGGLTPDKLAGILGWSEEAPIPPGSPLAELSWSRAAARTRAFFDELRQTH